MNLNIFSRVGNVFSVMETCLTTRTRYPQNIDNFKEGMNDETSSLYVF